MTETTTRPTANTTDQSAPHDPPSPVANSTAAPATMTVANNLSDDAILATQMLVAPGANSQALFANPFAAEREEMLFIDIDGNLQWLTHGTDGGWTLVDLMLGDSVASADEVVAVVHVDGTVWALTLSDYGLRTFSFEQDASGATSWVFRTDEAHRDAKGLQVQYLSERPARPVVLFRYDLGSLISVRAEVAVDVPAGSDPWNHVNLLRGIPTRIMRTEPSICYGIDTVRGGGQVYSIDEVGDLWSHHGNWEHAQTKNLGRADDVAGLWPSTNGLGCIAVMARGGGRQAIGTIWPDVLPERYLSFLTVLDAPLHEPSLWEDSLGRYHLYGMTNGTLRVIHQTGLEFVDDRDVVVPLPGWETLPAPVDGVVVPVAVSRPLTDSVDMYAVDPFPDEYPSQHVMHVTGTVPDAERCVIMTQDVTTSWWSREVVRLRAQHKPYQKKMHESRVTLTSQTGAPIARCPVTLTADRAVDFRIGGEFYRCGPEHPVTATTDSSGSIKVATVARDLIGCTIHVTAVGLPDGTSFNPVTDVHNFLGGNGTLPAHVEGISKDGLRDAKTSDDRWVFPAWHDETSLTVVPQPDEVLSWCRHAYQAKTTPQVFVTSDGGERVALRGIVLQTWDSSRPAYEEVTTAERAAELTAARAEGADDWDASTLGDIFLAIGNGLVTVVETGVDFLEGTASVVIEWVEGKLLHLKLLWDQSENPFQFIQAVFNELESDVEDVIDWLSWVFDWDDIMATADALRDGLKQVPLWVGPQLQYVRDQVVEGWFAEQKEAVSGFFTSAKGKLTGETFQKQPVPSTVPLGNAKNPPTSVVDPDKGLAPKTNWMVEWLSDHADSSFVSQVDAETAYPPEFAAAAEAFEDFLLVLDDEKVGEDFTKALMDLESLITNLFDSSDLQSLARTEIVSLLDLLEHLVEGILDLADAALHRLLTLIEKVVACIPAVLKIEFLEDTFLGWLWEYVCEVAGIDNTTPTLGDVFLTAISFLLTTVSKAVTGDVPFPDGYPDLSSTLTARAGFEDASAWYPNDDQYDGPEAYVVPVVDQARIQAMVGVFQMAFTLVDLYMDDKNTAGSSDPPEGRAEQIKIAAIVTFDLIAFGILDCPVFWGCNWLHLDPSVENGMWWGEWLCKAVIYLGDVACALLYRPTENTKFYFILGTAQGNFGNLAITVLGWAEFLLSCVLCGYGAERNGRMAAIWLVSQTLSMVSSLTAFMRVLPSYQENPDLRMAKIAIDCIGDLCSGFIYLVMGAVNADQYPRIVAERWPTEVVAGTPFEGVLYASPTDVPDGRYAGQIPFDPPGWRFDDQSQVPAGLAFGEGRPGRVTISGTVPLEAARDEPYVFDVRCGNTYEPCMSTTLQLRLTVTSPET